MGDPWSQHRTEKKKDDGWALLIAGEADVLEVEEALWVGLVGGGVAEGDAEDGAVGVAVGVRFT